MSQHGTFICDACSIEYEKHDPSQWSDADKEEEFRTNFPHMLDAKRIDCCDDCHFWMRDCERIARQLAKAAGYHGDEDFWLFAEPAKRLTVLKRPPWKGEPGFGLKR